MENLKTFKQIILLSLISVFISIFFWGCDSSGNNDVWVTFEKSRISMIVGEEQTLNIIVTPQTSGETDYILSSNNESIVTVKQDGSITAVSAGIATITATTIKGGNLANCVVTVLAEPVQLDTPTNISFDGDKVVWDRVPNKFGYKIFLNDTELERTYATNLFRDFEVGVENTIKIMAIGDDSAYLDSEWSEEFTFTVLNAPTISIANNKISFSSDYENALFDVYLDGNMIINNSAIRYTLVSSSLIEGSHTYKIKQVGDPEQNIYSSAFSNEIVVKKLSAPKNAVVSASVLTFDAVIGAQGYLMELRDTETDTVQPPISLLSNTYNFGNDYVAGKYDIRLMSIGDSSTNINSNYSTTLAVDKLNAPTDIAISNGIISWNRNTFTRNGFLINIYDISDSQSVQIIPTNEYFYNFKENCNVAGKYKVTITATGDNQNDSAIRYINSSESEPLEITKLSAPSNLRIIDNELVWDEIEDCSGYELIYGANTIFTTENHFSFLNDGNLTFPASVLTLNVRAIGDEQQTISSEQSTDISFTKLGSLQRTDFSIYQSRLNWRSVQNCMRYRVWVNDDEPIEVNSNYLDFDSEIYNTINFRVKVQAISMTNSYVMGEPSEEFTFQKLGTPTNLSVENGYLTWTAPENTGIITSYRIRVGSLAYITGSTFTQNDLHDYMLDGSTQTVSVQAICEDQTNQFMWGNFSESITLEKLSNNFNAKVINGEYTWDRIENASSYVINIKYLNEQEEEIIENMEYGVGEDRAIKLLELDFFDNSTTYTITIQALGTTGGQYISSKVSPPIITTRLAPTKNLKLSKGVIRWELDEDVDHYDLFINDEFVKNLGQVDSLSLDETYIPGDYNIKIFARGNQSSTLHAKEMEEPLVVTKLDKNFNISTNGGVIIWNQIQNASAYAYELRDTNNRIVSSGDEILNPILSLSNLVWNELFYLKIKAIGDDTRYINGDFSANNDDPYYIVKPLHYPTNLSVEKGILNWDYVENTNDYKIILSGASDGTNIEKVIDYTKDDDLLRGSYNIANYIKQMNLTGKLRIVIQSVGGQGVDAYLSSSYSDEVRVTKLEAPTLTNVNGVLNWNLIENAKQYKIIISVGVGEIVKMLDGDINKYELDSTFLPGNYNITIQSVGDESSYLSSEISATFEATKLNVPTTENDWRIRVENGSIVWEPIPNVSLYYIEVLKQNNDNTFGTHTTAYLMPNNTLNSYLFKGQAGYYKIRIKSIGESGTKYLNSSTYNYENILRKLDAPTTLHIEGGILAWTDIAPATKYIMNFSGYKKDVGKTQSFEMQNFASGQYAVSIQSVGNSDNLITSDFSTSYQVYKNKTAELKLKDYEVSWDKDYATDYYEINVTNLSNNVVSEICISEIELTTFDFNEFDSGYYSVKMRYVAGDYDEYAIIGYATSEWSDEFLVYKLGQIENFRLENDYMSIEQQDLEQLGSFSWDSVDNATRYKIICEKVSSSNPDLSYAVAIDSDIEELNYKFSDDVIGYEGAYRIRLIGYRDSEKDEIIIYDDKEYNVVHSDESIINTVKLPAPTNIYTQNANLYWLDPELNIDDDTLEIEYLVYWHYEELGASPSSPDYTITYIDKGIEHYVLNEKGETILKHSMPMINGIGKYQFKICAVSQNCIRSSIISCETYINENPNINTYYLFDFFEGGKGTEESPYIIKEVNRNYATFSVQSQLKFINYLPNNHYQLKEDVTLNSNFVPIGELNSLSTSFNGTFDGNDKCITTENNAFNSFGKAGLFGELKENAIVKNIKIKDSIISGSYNIMGFVTAENYGIIQNVTVTNSEINGTYSGTYEMYEGGIAGKNYGTIKNCKTSIYLHAESENNIIYVGGITGYNAGEITQCTNQPRYYASGKIYDKQIYGTMAGGIAGFNMGENAKITQCSNYATIYAQSNGSSLGGYSYGYAGGIVGKCAFDNTGGPTVTSQYPLIKDCYNRQTVLAYDVTNVKNSKAGGIIGDMDGGSIENCYNIGEISIIDTDGESLRYDCAGGLIGNNESQQSFARNSYYYTTKQNQRYIPTGSTPLSTTDVPENSKEEDYLKENQISDNYTLIDNDYQILAWEANNG